MLSTLRPLYVVVADISNARFAVLLRQLCYAKPPTEGLWFGGTSTALFTERPKSSMAKLHRLTTACNLQCEGLTASLEVTGQGFEVDKSAKGIPSGDQARRLKKLFSCSS